MRPKVGVVTFPGSLDDRDAMRATRVMGGEAVSLWHRDTDLQGVDAVILPGGFSYGDYLRTGAIARFSPILRSIGEHAAAGRPVLGICNGFQILCEAGFLPGALIRNRSLKFVCHPVHVRVETTATPFTAELYKGELLEIPVKHGEGQFVATADELARIESDGLVAFRYTDAEGQATDEANPNGATANIAGLRNAAGNVVGLMPHPEHAVDPDTGPTGGQPLFESLFASLVAASLT